MSGSGGEFGVRWVEFGRDDRMVTREKFFKTDKARDAFTSKLEKKDNFKEFDAWSNPRDYVSDESANMGGLLRRLEEAKRVTGKGKAAEREAKMDKLWRDLSARQAKYGSADVQFQTMLAAYRAGLHANGE